ncbi:MAG TPA: Calx-beta domain-containing protein, partial [Allosphingosinicella sp.]
MTTTPHQLSSSNFVQTWAGTSALLTADNWGGIASIVGYLGEGLTDNTSRDPGTILQAFTTVDLVNASSSAGTAGGVHEINDDVVALQGSGGADVPHLIFYLDSTNVQDVRFTATLRELDATTVDQKFAVQYRIGGTGNFTTLPAGSVSGVFNAAGNQTHALDVTLPADANNQSLVEIRVITSDAPGSDAMVGIDDITISSQPLGPVLPTLSIDDVTATEGDAGTVTYFFTVSLSAPAGPGGVPCDIATADGTAQDDNPATEDNDYVAQTLTGQTIPAGSSTYSFQVTVNGDTAVEPNETFFVNVTNITGATAGDTQGQGTIDNNDNPPVPAAAVADAAIVEGNSGVTYLVFTVNLSFAPTAPVTIDYATSNGTATAGSDYLAVSGQLAFAAGEASKTISVPIVGDTVPEGNETLTVTLSNASGATIGDGTAAGTITNDDGPGYFPLATGNFEENWTDTTRISVNDNWGGVPYIVGYLGDIDSTDPTGVDARTRTAANLGTVDVIANQTNPGTATSAGQTSGGVAEFQPTADPATTIVTNPTIAIQGSGTADAPGIVLYMNASGRSDVRLTATLRDLDGSADNAVQQINVQYRTAPNGAWTNVPGGYFADVTTGGSSTQTTALDVVLPAGANNSPTLEIRIMTTNANGSDEWVGIDDIVVSSLQSPPTYSIADAAVFEGTGAGTTPIVFTVTRAGDASAPSTVNYAVTFPGGGFSADAGDFSGSTSGTVSFGAGETSKTITLDIVADANPEADEAFTITLSAPSAGSIADGTATGTIVNDDGAPPFVTIADVEQAEGNGGTTTFTFTVTRTGGAGAFTVDYATTPGSATAGTDYVATSGTLNFAAGDNSETFTVTVNGDTAGELAETFGVQLSNPTGFAVLADPTATGTIQNDDLLFIHQVQGSSYYSPILKSEGLSSFNTASTTIVVIQAVISAVDNEGDRQGFYITEESGHWDANSLTSEGIFVMTRDEDRNGMDLAAAMVLFGITDLAPGHLVTVSAKVMEYQYLNTLPRTMLVDPSSITVTSTGNSVPELLLDA